MLSSMYLQPAMSNVKLPYFPLRPPCFHVGSSHRLTHPRRAIVGSRTIAQFANCLSYRLPTGPDHYGERNPFRFHVG